MSNWNLNPDRFQQQPTRAVAGVCAHCGIAIQPGQKYTYRQIVAWEEIPKSGTRGKLTDVETTGRVACRTCGPLGNKEQEALF